MKTNPSQPHGTFILHLIPQAQPFWANQDFKVTTDKTVVFRIRQKPHLARNDKVPWLMSVVLISRINTLSCLRGKLD